MPSACLLFAPNMFATPFIERPASPNIGLGSKLFLTLDTERGVGLDCDPTNTFTSEDFLYKANGQAGTSCRL